MVSIILNQMWVLLMDKDLEALFVDNSLQLELRIAWYQDRDYNYNNL